MSGSMRPRVYVTRALPGEWLSSLEDVAEVEVWPEPGPPPRTVLLEAAGKSEGLLTLLTDRIDSALLSQAPRLRVVSNMATGVDNIDVAACTAQSVWVGHTPGVLTETTADFTWALLLAAARRVVEADRFVRGKQWRTWDPTLLLGKEVHGATLGIAGMGAIGRAVARRAHAFQMKIVYLSRSAHPEVEQQTGARRVDKEQLLSAADFLSLHLPLTEATRHFIGARELAAMKASAVLINTARGDIVDPTALVAALRAGHPAAAALDVTSPEPPEPNDPLLTLPNVVFAPHLGSATHATRARMAALAVGNLRAVLLGQPPPHCVNPELAKRPLR